MDRQVSGATTHYFVWYGKWHHGVFQTFRFALEAWKFETQTTNPKGSVDEEIQQQPTILDTEQFPIVSSLERRKDKPSDE